MMRLLVRLWIAAVLGVACPAQSVTSKAEPGPVQSGPVQSGLVIHATANLVLVDVVVTDHGQPVQGLTAGQFHIFENGKEHRITTFEEHHAGDRAQVSAAPRLPPGVYSNYPEYRMTSAANVLLLDALNTPLGDQMQVRRQMVEYLRTVPRGTQMAVFTLGSHLRMVEGFTTDTDAVAEAVGKAGIQPSVLRQNPEDQDQLSNLATTTSGIDDGAFQQFLADTNSFQMDVRARMTLEAMRELGEYLSEIPGRKNLIWFSGSFPLAIDPDSSLIPKNPQSPLNEFSPMRDYGAEVKQTDDLLAAARVAVYPVDARGVLGLASVDTERSFTTAEPPPMGPGPVSAGGRGPMGPPAPAIGAGPTASQKADVKFQQETIQEHQTMDLLAEKTGGEAFYGTNGLKEAVAKAIANGSNYYTVGYAPPIEQWDGEFRRIAVKVEGEHYALAYRRGYYADNPEKAAPGTQGQMKPIVAALERGAPPSSQIVFDARVRTVEAAGVKPATGAAGAMAARGPVTRYVVDLSADPKEIAWTALPDGGMHAEIEVALVAWDAEGKRLNYLDQALNFQLTAAQSAQVAKVGLPMHEQIDLPAGGDYLRVEVHDLTSGRIGAMEIPLTVARR